MLLATRDTSIPGVDPGAGKGRGTELYIGGWGEQILEVANNYLLVVSHC